MTVALLFAPQSGEETRKFVTKKAGQVTAKGREAVRSTANDLIDQTRNLVSQQKDRLADVLESGKQIARDISGR